MGISPNMGKFIMQRKEADDGINAVNPPETYSVVGNEYLIEITVNLHRVKLIIKVGLEGTINQIISRLQIGAL